MTKLTSTKRGRAAIAAVLATSMGGYAMFGGVKVHDDVALASEALVQPWEGRALVPYLDKLAKPPVWTVCDGDTANVKPGVAETPDGCDKRLVTRMERDFRPALAVCIPNWETRPLAWRAMMLSLSWNIGTPSACHSRAAQYGRDGFFVLSCEAATAFNKSGGQVRIGLVNRRGMGDKSRLGEGELCRSGV